MSARPLGRWELFRTLPRVLPYLRPYRRQAVLSVLLMVVAATASLAQPWPLATMLDTVSGHDPPTQVLFFGVTDKHWIVVIAMVAGFMITVLTHGLTVMNSYVDTKLDQKMILDLRTDLFEHAQKLSLTFHDARQTGELMSRINYQASALGAVVMAFPPIAQSLLTLIGMATIAFFLDWQITLISLSAIPFVYYATGLYGTRIVPRLQRVQSLEWQSLSIVSESMSMLRVIVSFGRERYELKRFRSQGQVAVDERVKLTVRQTTFTLGVQTATALGTALVFGFGFSAVLDGRITTGTLIVLLVYVSSIYGPLEAITNTFGSLNEQLVSLRASFELLDEVPEVEEAPNAIAISRAAGAVRFEHIGFTYPGRTHTLEDVSFDIGPGQRVGVIGPTGAGKTTLMSLLIRFYDPQSGRILIDGMDIRQLTIESLRNQISVVLQEPMLFSGTIQENIRYGRLDASKEELDDAARAANAHDFIARLPNGYETLVGERGVGLSGGERQRVCVARAFIRDAPILILDEPTSSIDSKTEGVILDALERLMIGRTTFMIAHRLSTIRHADHIVVLNDGRVVEQGAHDEVFEAQGLYRQLYDLQQDGREPALARQAE